MNTIKFLKLIVMLAVMQTGFSFAEDQEGLNRPHFEHKSELPPLPKRTKQYINIANYNIRIPSKDLQTPNCWENRKDFYIKTIQIEDEARKLMNEMRNTLKTSLSKHLVLENPIDVELGKENNCTTCEYSQKEPFPILDTNYFRIALKTTIDRSRKLYGNFPYPYRIIIALKRHSDDLSEEEWKELQIILRVLKKNVSKDLGAEYTSYAVLQDEYFKKKNEGEKVSDQPHFILHFVFRFPKPIFINGVCFQDPTPYHQFECRRLNVIREDETKANSNFIYKRMPDIINIQELYYPQIQFLKGQLPNYSFIGYCAKQGLSLDEVKSDTNLDEILAIIYRTDRFECLDHGVRWISPTPLIPSNGYGASRNRIIIWAKFKDNITKIEFFMFNAHYDYDHLGGKLEYVDSEVNTIQEIAKDAPWFSVGERFYKSSGGEKLYHHYLDTFKCYDIRDKALFGHYGESGSFGGFEDDPFQVPVSNGKFGCDTLDICFTNSKKSRVILSYSFNGAYNPINQKMYKVNELIDGKYQLASDHFMTGFYVMLEDREEAPTENKE